MSIYSILCSNIFLSLSLSLSLYFLLSYFDHSTPEVSEKFPKYFQFLALLPFLPIFSIYLSSQSLACIFHLNLICGMSVTLLLLYLKLKVFGISRSQNNMFHMGIPVDIDRIRRQKTNRKRQVHRQEAIEKRKK